ncbi:MAG: helix-turn-helix domain-containing protein [Eubacteriales bacterium]|nr:helix-turn-helix domain-containing protein [Eubacteriales bacterium]
MIKIMNLADEQVSVSDVSVSTNSRTKGRVFNFRSPRESETLVYVLEGEIKYDIEYNLPTIVREKEMIYVPSGTIGQAKFTGKNNSFLSIRFSILKGSFLDGLYVFGTDTMKGRPEEIINRITSVMDSDKPTSSAYLYSEVYALMDSLTPRKTIDAKYKKLLPAIENIKSEYVKNYQIEDYACMCGMSSSSFRKLFTEYFGESPITYRTRVRLRHARELLACGEYSKAEIAKLTGFVTSSYFWREMKKYENSLN